MKTFQITNIIFALLLILGCNSKNDPNNKNISDSSIQNKSIKFFTIDVPLDETYSPYKSTNYTDTDSLEHQLRLLKDFAFCHCIGTEEGKTINKKNLTDSLLYSFLSRDITTGAIIQLTSLDLKYLRDSNLIKIIDKWKKRSYNVVSKDGSNNNYNLHNKKCLDFYNSKLLKNYIDSVRKVEIKKHEN